MEMGCDKEKWDGWELKCLSKILRVDLVFPHHCDDFLIVATNAVEDQNKNAKVMDLRL
jgi:hypothetical protein